MFRISQTGLADGEIDKSRTDGLSNGATVSITYAGTGTFRAVLLWVPPSDTTAVLSLHYVTDSDPKVWEFNPTVGSYGSYRIRGIENEGKANEKSVTRIFGIRGPAGLLVPAFGESANLLANLTNASETSISQSENNADDYPLVPLNKLRWSGWWRSLYELYSYVFGLVQYRDSYQVAGRALLPALTNVQLGCRVTCGNLGDEFVAVGAGTYPVDDEFVIASTGTTSIQWVWRNPVTGRLRFDPSDAPEWVAGLSAERALLRHAAGTITDMIIDGAQSSGGETLTTSYGGTPALSTTSYGGKPGINFDTSSWSCFSLPDGFQPGQSWGYLLSTAFQAVTANRSVLDFDNGSANDTNTYRLGQFDASELFNVFVLNSTTEFNSVANDDLMLTPYRGPSTQRVGRQSLGVFCDGGYKSYVDGRCVSSKLQKASGFINQGSGKCWINRQANGDKIGSQILHRLDLFNGNPGTLYLQNYDRFIHAGLSDKRVLCVGDSITWGYPLTNAQSWPTLLAANSALVSGNYMVENHGISGWQTTNVIQALASKIGPNGPIEGRVLNGKTIALVMIGINDCVTGKSSNDTIANIFSICDRLKADGAYVVLSTLLPATLAQLNSSGQTARDSVNNAIVTNGLSHANAIFQGHLVTELSDPSNATYYSDGLHLAAAGAVAYEAAIRPLVLAFSKSSGKLFGLRRGGGTSSMTSTDGGQTWTTNASAIVDANWYWITYDPNYNRHIAIANGSAHVATSTDGGTTWTTNASALKGATSFYKAVFDPVHSRTIAVSETGNICNYSTDGGLTWTQVVIEGTEHPWWGIAADAKHGAVIATSDNSTIRTTDGGSTWSAGGSLLTLFGGSPASVIVYDETRESLVVLSHSQATARSTDGGVTWVAGGLMPASRYWDSAVFDKKSGRIIAIACSGADRITAVSDDGGVTWHQGGTIYGIKTGYFRQLVSDPIHGIVIGPFYSSSPPSYVLTADGGFSWSVIEATGSSSASGTSIGLVP